MPTNTVYVQYPHESEPSQLWKCSDGLWQEISNQYADLFFRVTGSKAGTFGSEQEESFPSFDEVAWTYCTRQFCPKGNNSITVPSEDNQWSDKIFTGSNGDGDYQYLKFHKTKSEVRPRNMAIRLWKCVAK